MRLKYYELHQTPHESKKENRYFLSWDFMTWDLTIWGENKKDASTDSGLGASAQTLVLRRIMVGFFNLLDPGWLSKGVM